MASSKIVCLFMILGLALPAVTLADTLLIGTTYLVGDGFGWTRGLDVLGWLPKIVKVGDSFRFIFKDPQSVALVDVVGYTLCTLSGVIFNDHSGDFIYKFTKPGTFYIISAGPGDCTYDITKPLKMLVTVV